MSFLVAFVVQCNLRNNTGWKHVEMMQSHNQQESILVGCVLPTCTDRTCLNSHQMSSQLGKVNKLEQVSSEGHQMSLAGEELKSWSGSPWGPMSRGPGLGSCGRGVFYTLGNDQLGPPWTDWLTDGQTCMEALPSRNLCLREVKVGTSQIWTHVNILLIYVLFRWPILANSNTLVQTTPHKLLC